MHFNRSENDTLRLNVNNDTFDILMRTFLPFPFFLFSAPRDENNFLWENGNAARDVVS